MAFLNVNTGQTDKKIWILKSTWPVRYTVALIGVFVGVLIRAVLTILVGPGLPTYITFYPVVMIVALLAGFGPGVAITLTISVIADLWLFFPQWTFSSNSAIDTVGEVFFMAMGIFISLIAELYRHTRNHLEEMVASRTLKLNQINTQLEEEIKRRSQAEEELNKTNIELKKRASEIETVNQYLTESRSAVIKIMEDTLKVQDELRQSEKRLSKAQEIARLGSWELDLVKNQLSWSDEVYRIFGLKPQEFAATYEAFLDAIHPDDRIAVDAAYNESLAEGKDSYEIEHRVIRKSTGEVRIVHEKCEHIRDKSGKVIKSIGMVQDVTEDRQAEEELRRTRYYLESLFNYANAPIIVWNPEFKITKFNHAFEHLTGYQEQEVIDEDLGILFPQSSKDESLANISQTLTGKRWEGVEIPIQKKDGGIKTVLWNSANIYDLSGENIIATIAQGYDITKLKEIDKAKSEFISLASHQLRTPLSSISLSSELLLRGISGNTDPKQKEFIQEIFLSTQRMAEIINDLLNATKIEMGAFENRPQIINAAEFVSNVLEELNLQILRKGLILEKKYSQSDLEINFDKNILRAIIENLITNAIQYTPSGGKIMINIEKKDKDTLIQVTDTGCGIAKDEQDKLFGKLFRTRNAKEINPNGSGLGLYIAKSFADKTGAKIWVDSEEGKGSTFSVLIPKI